MNTENKATEPTEIYTTLLNRCKALGVTIAELSKETGASRDYFEKLKKRVPLSVQITLDIEKYLKEKETEKEAAAILDVAAKAE
jgi:hypothetical protein